MFDKSVPEGSVLTEAERLPRGEFGPKFSKGRKGTDGLKEERAAQNRGAKRG